MERGPGAGGDAPNLNILLRRVEKELRPPPRTDIFHEGGMRMDDRRARRIPGNQGRGARATDQRFSAKLTIVALLPAAT